MKKILILDAYSTRSLACVRSFGRRGIPFAVGGHSRWDMSLFSRYCRECFLYASPYVNIPRFIEDINRHAERFGADAVFPTSEAAIMACDLHRPEIRAELIMPTRGQIELFFQKRKTLALAEAVEVRIPKTRLLHSENLDLLPETDVPFPAIIKANASESLQGDRIIRGGKTTYVSSMQELVEKARERLETAPEILVQEFINGYGVGISGVFRQGEPVALFGHRRIRESDPRGGPSAVAESIPVNGRLYDSTVRIMRQTDYTGPAMVEYRIDHATGTPFLMEINGRLWGSILLPLAAGLDLPYLFWKVLNNASIEPHETAYEEGVIGRNLFGDTRHLALVLKGRPKNWPGTFPGRWEALRDYGALFLPGKSRGLLLSRDDPKPAYGRLLQEMLA